MVPFQLPTSFVKPRDCRLMIELFNKSRIHCYVSMYHKNWIRILIYRLWVSPAFSFNVSDINLISIIIDLFTVYHSLFWIQVGHFLFGYAEAEYFTGKWLFTIIQYGFIILRCAVQSWITFFPACLLCQSKAVLVYCRYAGVSLELSKTLVDTNIFSNNIRFTSSIYAAVK